jgi:hypothetical protein
VEAVRARPNGPRMVALSVLLVVPRVARAEAPPVDAAIAWSAPPECPDEAALRAEVGRLLARPLGHSGETTQVRGEVARDPGASGRYRLRLSITRAGVLKERQLDGETCAQVTDAAAVVLALAIDAEALPTEPPSPVDPPPAALIEVAPRPAGQGRASAAPAAPSLRARWDVAALAGVDSVSLPAPAAGLGLGVGLGLGADRIELRAMAWLPRRAMPGSPFGADVALYAAGLRYCRWLFRGMLDLAPCGGLEAGALVASAVGGGIAPMSSGLGRWLDPQLGLLGVFRPTPRFSVSLAADGLASIFRDQFVILGAGDVYRPPAATFRASLGVHVRLP